MEIIIIIIIIIFVGLIEEYGNLIDRWKKWCCNEYF